MSTVFSQFSYVNSDNGNRVLRSRIETVLSAKKMSSGGVKRVSNKPGSTNKSKGYRTSKKRERSEPTVFQKRVYDATKQIPSGYVSTYGDIARLLGTSSRAVGNALRNNPYAPVVPCHRVVASTRALYGFDGQCGVNAPNLKKKRSLLEEEGVSFDDKSLVLERCVWDTQSYERNVKLDEEHSKSKMNAKKRGKS
mmetsp:Transcript_363/g.443  ORF Transcript_363/g.443 Transcript_363/m.443 type:complete len:195 (+) Transcript_363:209-793(+)